jgi:hypothetical protein
LRDNGKIFLTTPTRRGKPIIEFLGFIGLLGKENVAEHKHYWNKEDLIALADATGFVVDRYGTFQGGCNQWAILKKKSYFEKSGKEVSDRINKWMKKEGIE